MSSANIHNIQALGDLKTALARFKSDALEPIHAAQQEIQRAQQWLAERERHWQREVQRCEEQVRQAQATLSRCQASGYRDKEGRYHEPDCSAQQRAVAQANYQLSQSRAELQNVQHWARAVEQAAAEFQREAQRLTMMLNNDIAKASALLENKMGILQGYVGDSAPSTATSTYSPRITQSSSYQYDPLDAKTNAQYKRETDTIYVNERLRDLNEPLLLEPLLAHERVHEKYKSDDPHDEVSLQAYTDEEVEAYKAQFDEWMKNKDEFKKEYPNAKSHASLGEGGANLLSDHWELVEEINAKGWDAFREKLLAKYRAEMEKRLGISQ